MVVPRIFKIEASLKWIRELANRIHGRIVHAQYREAPLSHKAEEESQELRLAFYRFRREAIDYIPSERIDELSEEIWELDRRVFEWVRAYLPPPTLGKELCRGIMKKATDMLELVIELYKMRW